MTHVIRYSLYIHYSHLSLKNMK